MPQGASRKSASPRPDWESASVRGVRSKEEHLSTTMANEIGSTVEGTVVRLAEYGAIVRLAGGKVGLVHISEVADTYVRDVRDYLRENDRICVKILRINDKGRYELSAKQADRNVIAQRQERRKPTLAVTGTSDHDFQSDYCRDNMPVTFEDKLTRFMKDSEERQLDLKRNLEAKRGSRRR